MIMNNYYVYIILDPSEEYELFISDKYFDKKPFYIGYGKNNRINEHFHKRELNRRCHKSSKIKSILEDGKLPIIIKLNENLTFEDANNLEIEYINYLGRIDKGNGILTNHTDGGGGTKNKILSQETKDRISKSCKGLIHTNETKNKMSISHTGKVLSENTKEKISILKKGELNGFFGKKHDIEKLSTCKKVIQIDINTNMIINTFLSSMDAERKTGIKHIYRVCNGTRKSAGGYLWKYKIIK